MPDRQGPCIGSGHRRGRLSAEAVVRRVGHSFLARLGSVPDTGRAPARRVGWDALVLAGLLALAVGLQVISGAYDADFCGHPDESVHFVTAVMAGEYLAAPFQEPMAFASRYYLQYPKVGIGHWPPLGYALQGALNQGFGSSRGTFLATLLVSAVVSAWLIYDLSWREAGRLPAAAAAAAWLLNAHVQRSYEQTMMDMPAASLCLVALAVFRNYVRNPRASTSLWFGAVACAALLVKQQAVVLALLPGAYVLVGRRPDLLRRVDFWMAAIPTLLIAVPWYTLTIPIFYGNSNGNAARWAGLAGRGSSHYSWSDLWRTGGVLIFVLSLIGFFRALVNARVDLRLWAGALLSGVACRALLGAMQEPRHLLFAFAAQLALAASAIGLLPRFSKVWVALALIGASWSMPTTPHRGYTMIARVLDSGPPGHILLESPNEGAVIAAETARRPEPDDTRYWLRSSKLLADVSWYGKVFRTYVRSTDDVQELLDHSGINQVYLEVGRDRPEPAFVALLGRALEERPGEWQAEHLSLVGGEARVFRRRGPLPGRHVAFFLRKLGRTIGEREATSTPQPRGSGP